VIALDAILYPDAWALVTAVALDLAFGDPVYRLHPVRLIGGLLSVVERVLRAIGLDGRGGGILLFLVLASFWVAVVSALVVGAGKITPVAGWFAHVFFLYSFMALGDLVHHVWRVEQQASAGNLEGAREAIAHLVGRDIDRMDVAACRRAAIESLSESLTDGFTSALFWYALGGLPGLTLFKVVSTMDSMVGYKTPRYLYFGWGGARLDDAMNFVPARMTWLLLSAVAVVVPGCSATKAFRVGLDQHGVLPGPNSGWSEAAAAGAIQRRIVGPVWRGGVQVTDLWIGDPADPPAAERADVVRAIRVCTAAGLVAVLVVLVATSLFF
jgi:adenosylcobinamide-phosphate synthase